jgi:hypothetical protein
VEVDAGPEDHFIELLGGESESGMWEGKREQHSSPAAARDVVVVVVVVKLGAATNDWSWRERCNTRAYQNVVSCAIS